MNSNVPSCHLTLTNPIQVHCLRCSGGPFAPKSSHRHAKRCLEPPDIWIDMYLTYIDELILAHIEDSCSVEFARKSKQLPTDRTSSCSSYNDRRLFFIHGNHSACVHAYSGESTSACSSLPFHQGVQKYSPHTSGITNKTSWQCDFVDLIVNVLRRADISFKRMSCHQPWCSFCRRGCRPQQVQKKVLRVNCKVTRWTATSVRPFREKSMDVPSCQLAATTSIHLHTYITTDGRPVCAELYAIAMQTSGMTVPILTFTRVANI